jgi:hypothetical protein
LGLEEPVELAGDVPLDTATDFGIGLALDTSFGGGGAGAPAAAVEVVEDDEAVAMPVWDVTRLRERLRSVE